MTPLTAPVTVVLSHGAAGSVRANFGPVLPCFSPAVRAFGPDFPGSGNTPLPPGDLTLDDLADRLVAASDARRFAVLGYSMGCAVAVRAAGRHPDRVSALVLTAGAPRIDPATRARIAQWRQLIDGDRTALARFLLSVMFSEAFVNGLTAVQERDFLDLLAHTVPGGSLKHIDLVERIDVVGDLPGVSVPTLVIGTRNDRLIERAAMRRYADDIPGARWTELDSGHAVAVEAPVAWARLVERFLADPAG